MHDRVVTQFINQAQLRRLGPLICVRFVSLGNYEIEINLTQNIEMNVSMILWARDRSYDTYI